MAIEVTLIIPSYKAESYIKNCLESVKKQTMSRDRFEVLIVENGPRDNTEAVVEDTLKDERDLNWTLMYDPTPSLSNARNVGIQAARGQWVTWVDVDDWLSPNFLEALTESASDGIIPLAKVEDVDEDTGSHAQSIITDQILALPAGVHSAESLWRSLGFAACKLLPVAYARELKFDVNLRSGEDVAYFSPFFARGSFQFDSTPAHSGATYFRLVRSGSMSRQDASFDFSVQQRLAVMKHLDDASKNAYPELKKIMHNMMRSQTLFAKRYLDEHPEELEKVVDAFDGARLNYTPWNILAGKTSKLAILYNFAPFADASAVVAAKRLVGSRRQWNVVNNDMSTIRGLDRELHEKILPYISIQKTIRNSPVFGSWKGVRDFCEAGLKAISEIVDVQGPQDEVYSRSMWPASHFLAALYKIRHPEVIWTAEFSDPLRKDVLGFERRGPVAVDEYWLELEEGVADAGFTLRRNQSLFAACEKVAYALADKVYFTNPHQLSYMLSYLDEENLKQRVSRVSEIQPHPVPPERFCPDPDGQPSGQRTDSDRIQIAYFGSFYPNRGPGNILNALNGLDIEIRKRFVLNIFTPNCRDLEPTLENEIREGVVKLAEALPYLDFLKEASRMDVLLVADADSASSGHRLNPYLPSKLSDYRGAGRPIWALCESGSVLSRSNIEYLSGGNDVKQAIDILVRMAKGSK